MRGGLQRRLSTGVNAVLVALFVTGIVALTVDLASRARARVDLSEGAAATLATDTLTAIRAADANGEAVEIIGTSHQRRNAEAGFKDRKVRDLLREIELESAVISTTWVDLDRDRQLAESLEITRYGTLVVRTADTRVDFKEREVFRRMGGPIGAEKPSLDFRGEALVARGVQQVLAGTPRKLVVLQGHGEPSPTDPGPSGLQRLFEVGERQGWDLEHLDLLRDRDVAGDPHIPEGTDVVLIVAPQTTLDPSEEEAIRVFMRQGGGLAVFLEPGRPVPEFLGPLGIIVPEGVAYDRPSLIPYDDWWLPRYGRHPIVEDLADEDLKVVYAHGAAVAAKDPPGVKSTALLRSSGQGWLEVVPERPPADLDPGVDQAGPVTVAHALEVSPDSNLVDEPARVVVIGDASGIGNDLMDRLGNPTFAVNALRWVVGDDERMALVGRSDKVRAVVLSPEGLSRVGWIVIGVWPLLIVLAGGIVWWLRRER